jgi:hypothetical protein
MRRMSRRARLLAVKVAAPIEMVEDGPAEERRLDLHDRPVVHAAQLALDVQRLDLLRIRLHGDLVDGRHGRCAIGEAVEGNRPRGFVRVGVFFVLREHPCIVARVLLNRNVPEIFTHHASIAGDIAHLVFDLSGGRRDEAEAKGKENQPDPFHDERGKPSGKKRRWIDPAIWSRAKPTPKVQRTITNGLIIR